MKPSTVALRQMGSMPRRWHDDSSNHWHVQITQGGTYVTANPREVLTTILGSCIAACIRDARAGVGGMNHFLLAEGPASAGGATRYGVHAMELLINAVLAQGGQRARLEAKLFGGANVIAGLSDVGEANVAFAIRFLTDEGIALAGGDVGGVIPRRVQYWPVSGRVRCRALTASGGARLGAREMAAASADIQYRQRQAHDLELL